MVSLVAVNIYLFLAQLERRKGENRIKANALINPDQLHLTPATSLIQLRPQLHHLDAYAEQERLSRPREAGGGGPGASTSASSGGPAGKDPAAAAGAPSSSATPRAITMTIKSASNANEVAQETMTDRLRAVQTEPWSRLRYENDASDRAWDVFSRHLLYKGPSSASADDVKGKGKIKERAEEGESGGAAAGVGAGHGAPAAAASSLRGRWSETEYLRAVSGRVGEGLAGDGDVRHGEDRADTTITTTTTTSSAAAASTTAGSKGKGKATATAAVTGTGARRAAPGASKGKSVAFKGTAMEID